MALATLFTNYVGNWRGIVYINSISETDTAYRVNVSLYIGRKGTGTLNTQTYYYRIGTEANPAMYRSSSKSLDKAGWTSKDQKRVLYEGYYVSIPKTYAEQTIDLYFTFKYGSGGTWYATTSNYTVTVPAKPMPDQPTVYTKVNGVWKPGKMHYKVSTAWKPVTNIYTKVSDVWKSSPL